MNWVLYIELNLEARYYVISQIILSLIRLGMNLAYKINLIGCMGDTLYKFFVKLFNITP